MKVEIFTFQEHALKIEGEKSDLLEFVNCVRKSECEGTLSDLAYKIEYAFDVDGIRSLDDKE